MSTFGHISYIDQIKTNWTKKNYINNKYLNNIKINKKSTAIFSRNYYILKILQVTTKITEKHLILKDSIQ